MSDPRPQIVQDLLADLDRCLHQPFAPWRLFQQWQTQRQLITRIRDVLSLWPSSPAAAALALPNQSSPVEPQSVSLEVVRSQLLEPLQADMRALTQQRQALRAEVAALESQRTLQQSQLMTPLIEQVEQLELFQRRADQVLKGVDGSLQLTFQSFDQDMAAYRRSLTQRFGQLEDLSQQSETIVATLLQRLIEEMASLPVQPQSNSLIGSPVDTSENRLLSQPSVMLPEPAPFNGPPPVQPSEFSRPSPPPNHVTLKLAQSHDVPAPASHSRRSIGQLSDVLILLGLIETDPTAMTPSALPTADFTLSGMTDLFAADAVSEPLPENDSIDLP